MAQGTELSAPQVPAAKHPQGPPHPQPSKLCSNFSEPFKTQTYPSAESIFGRRWLPE